MYVTSIRRSAKRTRATNSIRSNSSKKRHIECRTPILVIRGDKMPDCMVLFVARRFPMPNENGQKDPRDFFRSCIRSSVSTALNCRVSPPRFPPLASLNRDGHHVLHGGSEQARIEQLCVHSPGISAAVFPG